MTDSAPRTGDPASPPDWDAIARYLSGESNPDEAVVVRRWLDAHPADAELIEALQRTVTTPEPLANADVDVDAALRSVHARMAERTPPRLHLAPVRRRWPVPLTVAATALAAAVVFMIARAITGGAPGADHSAAARHANTVATGVGQIDSLFLVDGTRIVLGPASRLTVASDYATHARAVSLDGQALFVVRHEASRPFVVRAGEATIEDIGTSFAVSSEQGGATDVSVLAGRVRLASTASAGNSAELGAGDRGVVMPAGDVHAFPNTVAPDDTAWTSGRLVFHDAALSNVIAAIRRTYGVDVHVADTSLLGRHVTATFSGESADKVLEIIGLALGARVVRSGDSAMVYSARAPAARP